MSPNETPPRDDGSATAKVPEAEAAKIDRQIEEAARRIFAGTQRPNDFSNVNDLVRQRANLLTPSMLRRAREAS